MKIKELENKIHRVQDEREKEKDTYMQDTEEDLRHITEKDDRFAPPAPILKVF